MKINLFKKSSAFVSALSITLGLGAIALFNSGITDSMANETANDISTTTQQKNYVLEDPSIYGSEDEAIYGYLQTKAYGEFTKFSSLKVYLTEDEQTLYDGIVTKVKEVAEGNLETTAFTIPLTYTYEEAGLTNLGSNEDQQTAFSNFVSAKWSAISIGNLYDALLADNPYIFYWHDKTSGISYGCGSSGDGYTVTLNISVKFSPAADYKASAEYTVDTAKTLATKTAGETAAIIANEYSDRSTYDMLYGFKNEICNLVDYNYDAIADDYNIETDGINPWQLIYVFDGDSNTNVVCEGYSKAFMYLCQLAGFDECYLITGVMTSSTGSGNHMWNHVIVDEKSYLVDITNCDAGTSGAPDQLFMKAATKNSESSYSINTTSSTIQYDYDTTVTVIPAKVLSLSSTSYVEPAQDVSLTGRSLTLDGKIGINFYMELSNAVTADENAYMQFTLPNGAIEKINVNTAYSDKDGCYKFTCYVAAKEMTCDVKAQIVTSLGNIGNEYSYCVKDYANYILAHGDSYEAVIPVINSMLNYGGYTQTYFNYNADNLANAGVKTTVNTNADLSSFNILNRTGEQEGITCVGASLLLETDTTIRYYFKVDGGIDVSEYGFKATTGPFDSNYYCEVKGIAAHKLGEANVLTIGGLMVTYSPMNYSYTVTTSTSYSASLKNLCYAMYEYYEAAKTYYNSANA